EIAARLRTEGVLVSPLGPQVLRACTHLDVSRDEVEYAAQAIRRVSGVRGGQNGPANEPNSSSASARKST
ncbi:MAG TPA: hypothetical protein VGY53_09455, partial [Isosphaeraceae bacterium]|nr:hypothetical protein [Isosphaeraceae bacterium]